MASEEWTRADHVGRYGCLLALLRRERAEVRGVGLDFSHLMLESARRRFDDVDCFWKYREMALLAGRKPATLRA